MAVNEKSLLRKEVRVCLSSLTSAGIQERSSAICHDIKAHLAVCGAKTVAMFSPLHDEPQIWPLIEELAKVMHVVLPRVEGDNMQFYPYSGELSSGAYGIMEPVHGNPVMPGEIDVIIVPGVAFTNKGARMGRGKGFYDRYLSQSDFCGLKLGVCFKEQLVGELPLEEHDVKMDAVIYR